MNSTTLTIRLPLEQRRILRRTAKALKKSESEYIRDLVARDLDSRPLGERLGDLIGSLDSSKVRIKRTNSLKERILAHNWRK